VHDEQKGVMMQDYAELPGSEDTPKCEMAAQVSRSFGTLQLE
jgi:hypothetical protein